MEIHFGTCRKHAKKRIVYPGDERHVIKPKGNRKYFSVVWGDVYIYSNESQESPQCHVKTYVFLISISVLT